MLHYQAATLGASGPAKLPNAAPVLVVTRPASQNAAVACSGPGPVAPAFGYARHPRQAQGAPSAKIRRVRIKGNGSPVEDLLIFLSRPEASELRDAIDALLENFDDAGWHGHVSSADYQTEITIAPDVSPA